MAQKSCQEWPTHIWRKRAAWLACIGIGLTYASSLRAQTANEFGGADKLNSRHSSPLVTNLPTDFGLTGDWGGLRTYLFEKGFQFEAHEFVEPAWNLSGGQRRIGSAAGELNIKTIVDLEKVFGWSNASFAVTLTQHYGGNLNYDARINALMPPQEIYGDGDIVRLTQLYFIQNLFDGRINWKIGKLDIGADFAHLPCDAENNAFCGSYPGHLASYWHNWPIGQLGTVVRANSENKDFYFQIGAFEINPNNLSQAYAFHPIGSPPGATGAIIPAEFSLMTAFGDDGSLKGKWVVGGWYATAPAKDAVLDFNGNLQSVTGLTSMEHRGLYGYFINIQQMLTHPADSVDPYQGLRVFGAFTQTERRTAVTDNQIVAGLIYRGLFENRPNEEFMTAFACTHVNGRIAAADAATGVAQKNIQYNEYTLEAYYGVHFTSWLVVRPNFQLIWRPDAKASQPTTAIYGIKSVITF